ncbi:MAG: hypothetical protein ACK4K7_04075 [Allosphingosinicella sp.]|uniref:hypothetical protein n=1 Tax=Allosphingosinicella sp. TaxID=2823234 RepID=UPI003955F0FF
MRARFSLLLAVFALLLSSLGMAGAMAAAPASAAPMAAAAGHCDERRQPVDAPVERMSIDCAMACSALPSLPAAPAEVRAARAAAPQAASVAFHAGTRPESEPPPPRTA